MLEREQARGVRAGANGSHPKVMVIRRWANGGHFVCDLRGIILNSPTNTLSTTMWCRGGSGVGGRGREYLVVIQSSCETPSPLD